MEKSQSDDMISIIAIERVKISKLIFPILIRRLLFLSIVN